MSYTQQSLFVQMERRPRAESGDITARRHKGNPNSVRANRKVNKQSQSARIVELYKVHGAKTPLEIAALMGKHPHQISGRFAYLRSMNVLRLTGVERNDSAEHIWTGKEIV